MRAMILAVVLASCGPTPLPIPPDAAVDMSRGQVCTAVIVDGGTAYTDGTRLYSDPACTTPRQ